MLRIHRARVRPCPSGSRSSYGAERSVRPKSQRVSTVRRSVAKPELKPKAALTRANADGMHELGPHTYRMLKRELDHVMFKVEQDLPDSVDLTCEGEKDIVERWRNEMGDNLKNVLGLNVTKRLLNVFNPLNVKVHFTTKPDRKYLSTFLKRYNFVAFKRLTGVINTFAAQVKTIADFDALCTAKSIHCGAAKITITPFYRFTQCPKTIKTVFGNPEYMNDKDNNDLSDNINKTKDNSFTSIKSEDATKPLNTDVTKENNKPTTNNTLNVEDQKTEAKTTASTSTKTSISKVDIKVETPKPKVETPKPKDDISKPKGDAPKPKLETTNPKVITSKPQAVTPKPSIETPKPNVETPKPNVETSKSKLEPSISKVEPPTPKVEATKTIIKTPTPKVADHKPKVVTSTPNAKTLTPKPVPAAKAPTSAPATEVDTPKPKVDTPKPVVTVKTKVKNKQQVVSNTTEVPKTNAEVDNKTKNIGKVAGQTKNIANVKATTTKTVAKITATSKITKSAVTAKNVPKKTALHNKKATKKAIAKDDYEELDDHDILALISEGIVLDECSGSDVE